MTDPQPRPQDLPPSYPFRPDWELTPQQVRDMLQQDSEPCLLLDCRLPEERQIASIDPSLLLPLQQFAEAWHQLEPYRDRKIIVYCHHGVRSLQMAAMLRQHDFPDVVSMAGGIDLWARTIDPDLPRY